MKDNECMNNEKIKKKILWKNLMLGFFKVNFV